MGECLYQPFPFSFGTTVPELGYWIEVKPAFPNEDAQRKAYLFNYGRAANDDPVQSRERAYILYGDIPWPYPKEGNIVGYGITQEGMEDHSAQTEWDMIGGLCWQLCPICQQITIGRHNTMSCGECIGELGTLLEDALDCVESIPIFDEVIDIVPSMISSAVNTDFFRSGYKMPILRNAYTAARSMQFEGKRYHRTA